MNAPIRSLRVQDGLREAADRAVNLSSAFPTQRVGTSALIEASVCTAVLGQKPNGGIRPSGQQRSQSTADFNGLREAQEPYPGASYITPEPAWWGSSNNEQASSSLTWWLLLPPRQSHRQLRINRNEASLMTTPTNPFTFVTSKFRLSKGPMLPAIAGRVR